MNYNLMYPSMLFPIEDPVLNDQVVDITVSRAFPEPWMDRKTNPLISPVRASYEVKSFTN